jgi:hypothetical protein
MSAESQYQIMSMHLTCDCGAKLRMKEELAKQWLTCPRCGVIVDVPLEADGKPSVYGLDTSTPSPAPRPTLDPTAVVEPETPAQRKQGRAARRHLPWLDSGLALYYVTPFLFLAGTALAALGLVLLLDARLFDQDKAADIGEVILRISGVFLLLNGLLGLLATFLSLLGCPAKGSGMLILNFALLALGSSAAALLSFSPVYGPLLVAIAQAGQFGTWICWMIYLRELGPALERPEVTESARSVLLRGIALYVAAPLVLLMFGVTAAGLLRYPVLVMFISGPFIGAVATIVYHAGKFDSLLDFVLTLPARTEFPFSSFPP